MHRGSHVDASASVRFAVLQIRLTHSYRKTKLASRIAVNEIHGTETCRQMYSHCAAILEWRILMSYPCSQPNMEHSSRNSTQWQQQPNFPELQNTLQREFHFEMFRFQTIAVWYWDRRVLLENVSRSSGDGSCDSEVAEDPSLSDGVRWYETSNTSEI